MATIIESGKVMREAMFAAVRAETSFEDSFGVTLVCEDGATLRTGLRVLKTWSSVVRQVVSNLETATIFLPNFSEATVAKVLELLSMSWEEAGVVDLTMEMIDLLASFGINPGKVEAKKVEEEEVCFVCDLCDETTTAVERHMREEHGDIGLTTSEMKGFCKPVLKVENFNKASSKVVNWANIKMEPTTFVDVNDEKDSSQAKVKVKVGRVGKTSKRRKSSEVKSMPRCLVKLSSCRDLIRKLTKGGNDKKIEEVGNSEPTMKDQLIAMQDISDDEEDLQGDQQAFIGGEISD